MEIINGNLSFRLIVITTPAFFPGEADCLEGLLDAGLEKLHLRKSGATDEELEGLLQQLSPRWYSRLVLHGSRDLTDLAEKYCIPQIHCPVQIWREGRTAGMGVSLSLHSWEEAGKLENEQVGNKTSGPDEGHKYGLEYFLMSPLFDSISKPGYKAASGLLQGLPAVQSRKVGVIGLGGINPDTILPVIRHGWDGAAVLGWIWESPAEGVKRFRKLKNIIDTNCK